MSSRNLAAKRTPQQQAKALVERFEQPIVAVYHVQDRISESAYEKEADYWRRVLKELALYG